MKRNYRNSIIFSLVFLFAVGFAVDAAADGNYSFVQPQEYLETHYLFDNPFSFQNGTQPFILPVQAPRYYPYSETIIDKIGIPELAPNGLEVLDVNMEGEIINYGKMPVHIIFVMGNVRRVLKDPNSHVIVNTTLDPRERISLIDLVTPEQYENLVKSLQETYDYGYARAYFSVYSDTPINIKFSDLIIGAELLAR